MKKQNTTKCCEIHVDMFNYICPDCEGTGVIKSTANGGPTGGCPKCKGIGVYMGRRKKK